MLTAESRANVDNIVYLFEIHMIGYSDAFSRLVAQGVHANDAASRLEPYMMTA